MTTLVAGGATPRSFTSGNFNLSGLQNGPRYQFIMTPALDLSNAAYSGDKALLACNNDGGVYLRNRQVSIFNTVGGATGTPMAQSAVLTAGPGQAISVRFNIAAGTNASSIVVSGATTGNGSTPFTYTGTVFDNTTLGVGQFTNTNTFTFNGTISAVEDGVNLALATASSNVNGVAAKAKLITTGLALAVATCLGPVATGNIGSSTSSATCSAISYAKSITTGLSNGIATVVGQTGSILGLHSVTSSLAIFGLGASTLTAPGGTPLSGGGTIDPDGRTVTPWNPPSADSTFYAVLGRPKTATKSISDNNGNVWTLVGSPQNYQPDSSWETAVYESIRAVGGANTVVTIPGVVGDEATLFVTALNKAYIRRAHVTGYSTPSTTITSPQITVTGLTAIIVTWCGDGPTLGGGAGNNGVPLVVNAITAGAVVVDSRIVNNNNGWIQMKQWILIVTSGTYSVTVNQGRVEGARWHLTGYGTDDVVVTTGLSTASASCSAASRSIAFTIGNAQCVAIVGAQAQKQKVAIFGFGQSGLIGQSTGDAKPDARALLWWRHSLAAATTWVSNSAWQYAQPRQSAIGASFPIGSYGPELALAQYFIQNAPNLLPYIAVMGTDGAGFNDELRNPAFPVGGPQWMDQLVSFYQARLADSGIAAPTAIYLNHGESDSQEIPDADLYDGHLEGADATLRAAFGPEYIFVILRLTTKLSGGVSAKIRAAQEGFAVGRKNVRIVRIDDQNLRDSFHLDNQGLDVAGSRIAQAILSPVDRLPDWKAGGVPSQVNAATALTPTLPKFEDNDVAIMFVAGIGTGVYAPPTGFTLVRAQLAGGTAAQARAMLGVLKVGASNPTLPDIGGDDAKSCEIFTLKNVPSVVHSHYGSSSASASTTIVLPSGVAPSNDCLLVAMISANIDAANSFTTWPNGWEEQADFSSTQSAGTSFTIGTKRVPAGAFGGDILTLSQPATHAAIILVFEAANFVVTSGSSSASAACSAASNQRVVTTGSCVAVATCTALSSSAPSIVAASAICSASSMSRAITSGSSTASANCSAPSVSRVITVGTSSASAICAAAVSFPGFASAVATCFAASSAKVSTSGSCTASATCSAQSRAKVVTSGVITAVATCSALSASGLSRAICSAVCTSTSYAKVVSDGLSICASSTYAPSYARSFAAVYGLSIETASLTLAPSYAKAVTSGLSASSAQCFAASYAKAITNSSILAIATTFALAQTSYLICTSSCFAISHAKAITTGLSISSSYATAIVSLTGGSSLPVVMPRSLNPGLLSDVLIGVVDSIRRVVHSALGTKPYRVEIVTRRWSGERRGEGISSDNVLTLDPVPGISRSSSYNLGPGGRE